VGQWDKKKKERKTRAFTVTTGYVRLQRRRNNITIIIIIKCAALRIECLTMYIAVSWGNGWLGGMWRAYRTSLEKSDAWRRTTATCWSALEPDASTPRLVCLRVRLAIISGGDSYRTVRTYAIRCRSFFLSLFASVLSLCYLSVKLADSVHRRRWNDAPGDRRVWVMCVCVLMCVYWLQVSKCHRCHQRYDALPREREWGWAEFHCPSCQRQFKYIQHNHLFTLLRSCETIYNSWCMVTPVLPVAWSGCFYWGLC